MPKCFDSMMAHYGKFSGVENYIALGYGTTQGVAHKSKPVEQLCNGTTDIPDWLFKGSLAL